MFALSRRHPRQLVRLDLQHAASSKPSERRGSGSSIQPSEGGAEARGRGGISDAEQSRRFIETARELGCDEDEVAFDEKQKRIASATPKAKRSNVTPPTRRKNGR